jgi:methylmalonyl-CoA/ethylmalonyl-CoA epimerase
MTVRGLAHVGILVPDLEPARTLFADRLGLEVTGPEDDEALGLRLLWVRAGAVVLELVAPLRPDSRAAAALARGEAGVHHVALEVEDVDAWLARLVGDGVPVRDPEPRAGAHGSRVVFIDPAATGGALVELVEPSRGRDPEPG